MGRAIVEIRLLIFITWCVQGEMDSRVRGNDGSGSCNANSSSDTGSDIVGIGTAILLEYSDNHLGITERVIAGLDELCDSIESYIAEQKRKALNVACWA